MSEEKTGGEKSILEERRKKLEDLRERGIAYINTFHPKNMAKNYINSTESFQKKI